MIQIKKDTFLNTKFCKNQFKKIVLIVSTGVFFFIIGSMAIRELSRHFGLGIIVTKSLDKSYFVYSKAWETKIAKGEIIYFDFPFDTPYYKKDSKFGKIVMCEAGDTLKTDGLDYYCNGQFLGTARTTDSKGNVVSNFKFDGIIPSDNYFVMGTHDRSFDSRYWGFVEKSRIRGIAIWSI